MEITTSVNEGILDIVVDGRLDGYWADHLDRAVADVVRNGHHRVRLDCSRLQFLSSAGIAILLKFYKELSRLNGSFRVINPSPTVTATLKIARLTDLLFEPSPGAAAPPKAAAPAPKSSVRALARDGAAFEVHELNARAQLTCAEVGNPAPLASGAFRPEDCRSLESLTPMFALGVGAFGSGFEDCRGSFGEMLSVAGTTAYQPAGSTNVADYLLASGALTADVQMLYGLTCDGQFSHLLRFEVQERGTFLALSRLIEACFASISATSIGFVAVAETSGLVGAALRRSPAEPLGDTDFFAHPGIRSRLTFTAEPAYVDGVTLAAGIASKVPAASGRGQLRAMGPDWAAHVHAAAFRFRPIKKGLVDLRETVTDLFGSDQLLGVLHLLRDDRAATGARESEFVRGACWVGPVKGPWETAR